MLSDLDALNSLPEEGWLRTYVEHGIANTTAPAAYHIAVGLTLLAVTCPLSYGMYYAASPLRPNLYAMLVGRSGDDQKSTCISIGRSILWKVAKELIGDQPGSPEGLVESLSQQPQQLILYSEFGKFLAGAQQQRYFEPIKALITDLWDCEPQSRRKVKEVVSVENPRLSMLVGCSLPYLEKHTAPEDWTGGFLGRWLLMYGKRSRIESYPRPDDSRVEWLVEVLKQRIEVDGDQVGFCTGLDEEAYQYWDSWYKELDNRKIPEVIAGAKTRVPAIALKVALLHAWDRGTPIGSGPWLMDAATIYEGIKVAELHLCGIVSLSDKLAEHPDAAERRNVVELIPLGTCMTFAELLERTKYKRKKLGDIVEGLLLDGTFQRQMLSGGNYIVTRMK